MKKAIAILLALSLMLSLCACGSSTTKSPVSTDAPVSAGEDEQESSEEQEVSEENPGKQVMGIADFEALLSDQPLVVVETEYVVQSEQYKSLYPDMLQAILQNNTTEDIKDAVIAFVAWDENDLPVKIEGQIDFSNGAYVKRVNYTDINLVSGGTYGDGRGYLLGEDSKIATFKACVVSFETFDGETWKNPYYENFCALFEGKKYAYDLTTEVKLVESTFTPAEKTEGESTAANGAAVTADELEAKLAEQPLTIISTEYVIQNEQYKSLYPDMLQAILQNNTAEDIKDAVVAFVAWDENKLPVKIEGQLDFSNGAYVKKVNYADINLVGGGTYGEDSGYSLSEKCKIDTFKAIVVSYETFDGETWENPYYKDFCSLYEGQRLG